MDERHAADTLDAWDALGALDALATPPAPETSGDPGGTGTPGSPNGPGSPDGPNGPGALDALDAWSAISAALTTRHTAHVTPEGADWLASASAFPRSVRALWSARPGAPSVLPCGTAFDVVNAPALFGRRLLERLWASGPGSGPVAVHRGRVLLLVAPGTAQRLPSLLEWEEWSAAVPPLLCHGFGDAVTVPPLFGARPRPGGEPGCSRWVVAPDTRRPWLPGPDVMLWACVRAARTGPHPA